jgi:methyl-accepting chemotaxis protein
MAGYFAKLGVTRTLLASIAAALALAGLVTAALVGRSMTSTLEEALRRHGLAEAQLLAAVVAPLLAAGREDLLAAEIEASFVQVEQAYVVVLRQDLSIAAKLGAEELRDQYAKAPEERVGRVGDLLRFAVPIRASSRGDPAGGSRDLGVLLLGHSASEAAAQAEAVRTWTLWVMGLGGLLLATVLWWATSRLVLAPLDTMARVARRLSDSDLSARAERVSDDELGALADSLNRIGENLSSTMERVQTVTGGVAAVIERIDRTGKAVSAGSGTVSARVVDTSASMIEMVTSLKGIADNVEVLARSAEDSSASIVEMAASNDEVAENIQALAGSVEETTAAIEEMTYSIKEVAKNIEDLSATTEETSSSMNEMDVSISQVETNANETAKLSEQAQRDAEMGAEALSRTLQGIDKIKGSSKEAASVIEALGKKIAAIGNILNVIDDVAEQTNLLALNAAILAAQSGEHGKGFAVVADEIKDLAERTGASTKEISDLIRAVQEQSKNAVTAMDRGVRNVEEGVRLGQETETALKKIEESSHKATQMVKAIARATIEQARGSKQVTMAINRIAETVQQIATATAEQARGSEQIMKSAERMKSITKHVERSAQEQSRGSKQITKAIESINEQVHQLNHAQKEQTKGLEEVQTAVVQIKQVAEAQNHSARELEGAITDLAGQADVLRGEVKRFRIS